MTPSLPAAFANRVSRDLGVDIPIVQAPMGWIARSQLAAAVSQAGACGIIETSSGGGTNVRATISYDPPAGALGRIVAKLFQREPGVQARQDLDRLKAHLEK